MHGPYHLAQGAPPPRNQEDYKLVYGLAEEGISEGSGLPSRARSRLWGRSHEAGIRWWPAHWAGSVRGGGRGDGGWDLGVLRELNWLSWAPHHVPVQPCDPVLFPAPPPPSVSRQFSGNPTPSGWRIKGQCVETWPSSSASSPLQCRNTLALCPGRRTLSPSPQVRRSWGPRGQEGWDGRQRRQRC